MNFARINDYFYSNQPEQSNHNPSYFIKDLVKGIDVDSIINELKKDNKFDSQKLQKLKESLILLNEDPKILNWVEPVFITNIKKIIASKWDHIGSKQVIKDRGAFFTPDVYVEKITTYVKNFINEEPNNPYLIIDRCAGTGNLEKFLSDDILANTILNTFEFAEWVYMGELFKEKVKMIRPPYNNASLIDVYIGDDILNSGDALSEGFNIWLSDYLLDWRARNPNGRVLFLENPPFRDETANSHGSGHAVSKNYVLEQIYATNKFKKYQVRDLSFQFIYSASMHMRENDQYCLISPIKYWKWNYINFEFVEGYLSNRKDYNATEGGLPIIRWKKTNKYSSTLYLEGEIVIKQINKRVNEFQISNDKKDCYAQLSIGNMLEPQGNILTNLNKGLTNKIFHVKNDNIKQIAVLHCANSWKSKSYEKDYLTIMKSADKQELAWKDEVFLNDCLLWILISDTVKCFSFQDDKEQKIKLNEICMDGLAAKELNRNLFEDEHYKLIKSWEKVKNKAQDNENYNQSFQYSLEQIRKELNIKIEKRIDNYGKRHYDYKDDILNSHIIDLKRVLTDFYSKKIEKKLFEYELLK